MQLQTPAHLAAQTIQQHCPGFTPKIGIILGSGLGDLAQNLKQSVSIDYSELPGFPHVSVHGHGGNLVLGQLNGVNVVCLQGRAHAYEGDTHEQVKTYVRTLKLLGCEYFIATNAAGSLKPDVAPGELVLVTDHINLQPTNPLVGPNDEEFGPRFVDLTEAYDLAMRKHFLAIAAREHISLHQGVYISVLGPNFETAAEIRAFRLLGADIVGMSTVPEVLIARHCGLKVAVISTITNFATGLSSEQHDHAHVVLTAKQATAKLTRLVHHFVAEL